MNNPITVSRIVEELSAIVGHKHALGCAYFRDFDGVVCNCSEKDVYSKIVRTKLTALLDHIEERVAAGKKNLVVDNWEDGKAHSCNPRCHDSGKEDAFNTSIAIIRSIKGEI